MGKRRPPVEDEDDEGPSQVQASQSYSKGKKKVRVEEEEEEEDVAQLSQVTMSQAIKSAQDLPADDLQRKVKDVVRMALFHERQRTTLKRE